MAERTPTPEEREHREWYVIRRCPHCKAGPIDSFAAAHWDDCPNWNKVFAVEEVFTVPRERAEREIEQDNIAVEAYRKERDWLEGKLREAECDSGVWEARFMDEQTLRRAAERERDEALAAARYAKAELGPVIRARDELREDFESASHLARSLDKQRAEHERVRREVARELRHHAIMLRTARPTIFGKLCDLADRLAPGDGE